MDADPSSREIHEHSIRPMEKSTARCSTCSMHVSTFSAMVSIFASPHWPSAAPSGVTPATILRQLVVLQHRDEPCLDSLASLRDDWKDIETENLAAELELSIVPRHS